MEIRFKTSLFRLVYCVISLVSSYSLSAQSNLPADIRGDQLQQFVLRGFGYASTSMNTSRGWNIDNYQSVTNLEIRELAAVESKNQSWSTNTYFPDLDKYFFQKISLSEITDSRRVAIYATNSERKIQQLEAQLLRSSKKLSDNEFLINSNQYFSLQNGLCWEKTSIVDESYNEVYTIVFYHSDFLEFYRAQVAWDKSVENYFTEDDIRDYIETYPNTLNCKIAKSKLEEIQFEKIKDAEGIDRFLIEYPNSKYKVILTQRKEEIRMQEIIGSNDEQLIANALLGEKNHDNIRQLISALRDVRMRNFRDSSIQLENGEEKVNLIKRYLIKLAGSDYYNELIQELYTTEFQILSMIDVENCEVFANYNSKYPESPYFIKVKIQLNECIENARKKQLIDSLFAIYNSVKFSNEYKYKISIGNAIVNQLKVRNLQLEQELATFQRELQFLDDRRIKVYPMNEVAAETHKKLEKAIFTSILNNNKLFKNVTFTSNLTIKVDTFGNYKLGCSNYCETILTDKIIKPILPSKQPIVVMNLPVMSQLNLNISYLSKSETLSFTYLRNGQFQDNAESPSLNSRKVQQYLNANLSDFKPGIYRVDANNINLNQKTSLAASITKYRSFRGVSSILPAMVIPGLGTKLVTGRNNKAWISLSVYALMGSGIYFLNQSNIHYYNYKSAANQQIMDQQYSLYLKNRDYALFTLAGGTSVYSINLTYVLFKGLSNQVRTLSLVRKYKRIKFDL